MAGDVRISFNVSCSSDGSCGFDHLWTGWLLLSVQWSDMDKPAFLFVPLRGPAFGEKPGEGDDTPDVAQEVANAVGNAIGQGTISRAHRDQISVETNPGPGAPGAAGNTQGRITFKDVTHVDCQATEAKLNLNLAWRSSGGSAGIIGGRRPKPPRIYRPLPPGWKGGAPGFWTERFGEKKSRKKGFRRWATVFSKMPDRDTDPWPSDDAPPWIEIPYKPRLRQFSIAAPPTPQRGSAHAQSSDPETRTRFAGAGIVAPVEFAIQAESLQAQMHAIGAAVASQGINVAVDGPKVLLHDAEAVELQLSGEGEEAFPWHIAVEFGPMGAEFALSAVDAPTARRPQDGEDEISERWLDESDRSGWYSHSLA